MKIFNNTGGTGTGDWKTDGQHYIRCQRVHFPVPAAVRGTIVGECGLISQHVHRQLARCNPLFHFYVLVRTGFVLMGQIIMKTLTVLLSTYRSQPTFSILYCIPLVCHWKYLERCKKNKFETSFQGRQHSI